jgi:hypothetical protein
MHPQAHFYALPMQKRYIANVKQLTVQITEQMTTQITRARRHVRVTESVATRIAAQRK